MTPENKRAIKFVIFYMFWTYFGYTGGKATGLKEGKKAGYEAASRDYESELQGWKEQASTAYKDGYNDGTDSTNADCDSRVETLKSVQVHDLKEAYRLGQTNGIKRAEKICGVKIKF